MFLASFSVASATAEDLTEILKETAAHMVEIPSGTYMMWATPGSWDKPGHWVEVDTFLLNKYEVTQRQYETVMGRNPSYFKGDPALPVEQVSWEDSQEFIKRLNALEGEEVYRLPTEAEWEYACLSGSGNAHGFCDKGDRLSQYAWYGENSGGKTHPVGQLKPNPWGLYDVHGNVWEWCQDWHGEHVPGEVTKPEGLSPAFRVLRGGGYDSPEGDCRSHTRRSYSPTKVHRRNVGLRLAATGPVRAVYGRVVKDHPELGRLVAESGFDSLTINEQQELVRMVERYGWLLSLAKGYEAEYPAISDNYLMRAKSLKKQIESRFGHVLKE